MAFDYTFRGADMPELDIKTRDLFENRDQELELFLRLADPTGRICQWHSGITAPDGWLLCNGASVSVDTYNGLFKVIGYTYGGSGANFTLPTVANHIIRY